MPANGSNVTVKNGGDDTIVKGPITWDDATWILTSAFIIFTMQSGFGMLEAGAVARKNTVNIMVKNVVDVVFGGMTYWMFGYAFSFGDGPYSNPFCGLGDFFVDTNGDDMGLEYATFVFQLSFATTATTIVSGAMAERTNLTAYIVFSFFNTIVYCIPAHWVWASAGFLSQLGVVDFAGSGVVHLVGASSGLVATVMLKPRTGRYAPGQQWPALVNPVNAIMGTFMLWWGWLAFNCGSTFGISGGKWMLASKAAFNTLLSSMAGGVTGTAVSYITKNGKYDVGYLINSILGALVSITASCPLVRPYEAVIIGTVGALCTLGWCRVMDKMKVDDPVSAVAVHGASGMWGLIAVGLFVEDDNLEDLTSDRNGLLKGGGFYLLGVQLLCIVCELAWSGLTTYTMLFIIDKTIGLRVSLEEERLGSDYCEHGVGTPSTRILDEISPRASITPSLSAGRTLSRTCLVNRPASVGSTGGRKTWRDGGWTGGMPPLPGWLGLSCSTLDSVQQIQLCGEPVVLHRPAAERPSTPTPTPTPTPPQHHHHDQQQQQQQQRKGVAKVVAKASGSSSSSSSSSSPVDGGAGDGGGDGNNVKQRRVSNGLQSRQVRGGCSTARLPAEWTGEGGGGGGGGVVMGMENEVLPHSAQPQ